MDSVKHIVIAFIFGSFIYDMLHQLIIPTITSNQIVIKDVIVNFLTGRYHMWFCYLIMDMYIWVHNDTMGARDNNVDICFAYAWNIFDS